MQGFPLLLWAILGLSIISMTSSIVFNRVFASFGENIGSHVRLRILQHLRGVPDLEVFEDDQESRKPIKENTLLLNIGNTTATREMIPPKELRTLI